MAQIITREQVKIYLGISDASLDAQIDRYIPIVDAAVKQITRRGWDDQYRITTVASSTEGRIVSDSTGHYRLLGLRGTGRNVGNLYSLPTTGLALDPGQTITGSNIADDTHIQSVQDNIVDYYPRSADRSQLLTITLSQPAVATGTEVATVGINISFFPLISKAVNWFINQENRENPQRAVSSKLVGPLSLSWSSIDTGIDGRYGVPSWLVKGLPKYMVGY